jgi:hypothetical protein
MDATRSRDGKMETKNDSLNNRKGKFLWMEPRAKENYLDALKKKIAEGYFYSDKILSKVVDELAPVLNDNVNCD